MRNKGIPLHSALRIRKSSVNGFRTDYEIARRSAVDDVAAEAIKRDIEVSGQSLLYLTVAHRCGQSKLALFQIIRTALETNVYHDAHLLKKSPRKSQRPPLLQFAEAGVKTQKDGCFGQPVPLCARSNCVASGVMNPVIADDHFVR